MRIREYQLKGYTMYSHPHPHPPSSSPIHPNLSIDAFGKALVTDTTLTSKFCSNYHVICEKTWRTCLALSLTSIIFHWLCLETVCKQWIWCVSNRINHWFKATSAFFFFVLRNVLPFLGVIGNIWEYRIQRLHQRTSDSRNNYFVLTTGRLSPIEKFHNGLFSPFAVNFTVWVLVPNDPEQY